MAMPQVHIVAYCGDLGYGVARGAEMLSLMLGLGIISRIGSGFVADRIGGAATLVLGSVMQGLALFLYLLFDGLTSLYVVTGIFGLFQGGIVPMYAVIIREYLPAKEAGMRIGLVHVGDHSRHGLRRLCLGRDLRLLRLLPRRLPQRPRLEPRQPGRGVLADAAGRGRAWRWPRGEVTRAQAPGR